MSLRQLVTVIDDQWTNEESRQDLWRFYETAHMSSNQMLHSSFDALSQTVAPGTGSDVVRFEMGPTDRYVRQALFAAFWNYTQILTLMRDHFAMADGDALDDIIVRGRPGFFRLAEESRRATGRNARCPCGSGLKFKHCHGA